MTTDYTPSIQDMPRLFSKYGRTLAASTVASLLLFLMGAQFLTPKYKSHFVLTINPQYFQGPLIEDFVPEIGGTSDLRAQKESLIRQAITPGYLDSIGIKYGIYPSARRLESTSQTGSGIKSFGLPSRTSKSDADNPALSDEQANLRSRIELFTTNGSFNVSFVYSDPEVTWRVAQDIYGQVTHTLLTMRMNILASIREALISRIELMSARGSTPAGPSSVNAHAIQGELSSVRNQLSSITTEFTEQHPAVIELRRQEKLLTRRLDELSRRGSLGFAGLDRPSLEGGTREFNQDLYEDLLKKLSYINIAIDTDQRHQNDYFATLEIPMYPSAPLWPKKTLAALWGAALGFFGSLFLAALREYFDQASGESRADRQTTRSRQINLPVLGELPLFPSSSTPQEVTPPVSEPKLAPHV